MNCLEKMKNNVCPWPSALGTILVSLACPYLGAAAAISSGEFQTGAIGAGSVDAYTFTGNPGDNIVVRVGTTNFDPRIDLYVPGGALVTNAFTANANYRDAVLYSKLTNSGTFTAAISSYFAGGAGTYGLKFAQIPGPFVVPTGEQGGSMNDGATYTGQINLGGFNLWSFSGNAGDNIQLRMGATNFSPRIDLYGPNGALLTNAFTINANYRDAWLALQLPSSGTFTVVVSSYFLQDFGGYSLNLAQIPGPFVVSPGEQGGPLTNGVRNVGQIGLGGLQMWAFAGNAGDSIQLRMGTTDFSPRIDLYGPNGALLTNAFTINANYRDTRLALQLPSSGTFTVVVSSYFLDDFGGYSLNLAQIPGPFVVSPGEQGGPLTNGVRNSGQLGLGDLGMWAFSGNSGDSIQLRMGATNFTPRFDLYGPDGALLTSAFTVNGNNRDASLALRLTNSGTYTVVVSSYFLDDFGGYSLNLAQIPGGFTVSPGDFGGVLTNGFLKPGTIDLGGLDMWSFSANAGDNIELRMGADAFDPRIDLYGPDGALVTNAFTINGNYRDAALDLQVANTGTFTVVASSYFLDGTGNYTLTLAHEPGQVFVASGDEGGTMTDGFTYQGTNSVGDLDAWTFYGTVGDSNLWRISTVNFTPYLRLYGPNGALVGQAFTPNGNNRTNFLTYGVTNAGNYTLVSAAYYLNQSGTYNLKQSRVPPDLILPDTQTIDDDGSTLNVPVSAQDPDDPNKSLTFVLVSGPLGATLTTLGPTNASLSWTPTDADGPSTNLIVVSVTDVVLSRPFTRTNSFTVVVREVNKPPVLPAVSTQTVNELTSLTVTNAAAEPDLHSITVGYSLVSPPTGATIDANGVFRWTPAQTQSPSTNTIITVVTNSNPYDAINPQLTATNSFTVVVKEVNVAPTFTVIAPQTANELTVLAVTNAATEPNIQSTTTGYTLLNPPAGAIISPSGVITWTPAQTQSPSTNTITTVVTNTNPYDAINPQLTATSTFTVIVKEVNMPPVLPAIAPLTVNELTVLTVTNAATEPNIHSSTTGYGLINPPAGAIISPSGVITWTPTQTQSPSTNTITTVVTNTNPYDATSPQLAATNTFTVIVKEVNMPPILPDVPLQTIDELAPLTVTNTATEPNIHATTTGYALLSPPLGVGIDSSGVITWTPTRAQSATTNTITTVVTNADLLDTVNPHLAATNSFTVIVRHTNAPPVLQPIADRSVHYGVLLSVQAVALDPDTTDILTYSLTVEPTNMTINATSGLITWTPTLAQFGSNTITVKVTDNGQPPLNDTTTFHVRVTGQQPQLTAEPLPGHLLELSIIGDIGVTYELQVSTNLTGWDNLAPVTPTSSPFLYIDPSFSTLPQKFYRLELSQ